MLTSVAVLLVGIWLAIESQEKVPSTLTLIFGVVVALLALLDLLRAGGGWPWHRAP